MNFNINDQDLINLETQERIFYNKNDYINLSYKLEYYEKMLKTVFNILRDHGIIGGF